MRTAHCQSTLARHNDAFGNLRGVALANGTAISYVIDGQNRRVGKKVNGTLVESFLYERNLKRVGWYDATGALKAQFIFGARSSVPEFMVKGAATYRLISDQVGSVRLVADSTGSVVQRIDYDEFGNVLADTASGFQPFGFAGGLRDLDTGLTRFGARDYDPRTGRWTTKDEIRFRGGTTNLYGYGSSDPVNRIDPDGHNAIVVVLTVVTLVTAAYGLYKFIDASTEAGKAVEKRQELRPLGEREIDKMLRGEPFDPSIIEESNRSEQQAIRDTRDILNNLPPGTSMTPDAAHLVLKGQRGLRPLCPK